MATANFSRVNTNVIYAFGKNVYIDREAIEANDWDDDMLGEFDDVQTQFNYECAIENAQHGLKKLGWYVENGSTSKIASKDKTITAGGCSFYLNIYAKVESGYYEGATFDLDGEVTIYDRDGYEVATYDLFGAYAPTAEDVITENWTGNNGLNKIHGQRMIDAIGNALNELTDEAEKVFAQACENRLTTYCRFSNGETWYTDLDEVKIPCIDAINA